MRIAPALARGPEARGSFGPHAGPVTCRAVRKLACGLLAASLATVALPAKADEIVEPVRMEVDANVECSNDRLFFDEVRARTARVRWAEPEERARAFRVRIRNEGNDIVGTLTIVDESKASAPRTFKADSCKAVIEALAFVAAVSIDPAAHREGVLALPPAPALPLPPPAPPPEWPSETPVEAPPDAPLKEGSGARSPDTHAKSSAPRSNRGGWIFAIGAGATVEGPDTLSNHGLGARAFAEVGRVLGPGRVALAPTARVSFDLPSSWSTQVGAANANFTWTRGAADVCPIRVRLASSLFAAPCAGIEVGAVEASTTAPHPLPATTPWAAVTLSARLRLTFLRVLFAEVEPSVDIPFVRQQFKLHDATNTDVYQAPPLYVGGLLVLGVHFP
jgi:hypothetical protein